MNVWKYARTLGNVGHRSGLEPGRGWAIPLEGGYTPDDSWREGEHPIPIRNMFGCAIASGMLCTLAYNESRCDWHVISVDCSGVL